MITVVSGPPKAGKTTYVNKHRKTGDLVWDYDAVVSTMFGLPMHHDPSESVINLMQQIRDVAVAWVRRMPREMDAWIIISNKTQAEAVAEQLGARLVAIGLDHLPAQHEQECIMANQA